jgi:flagellar P-ring protein precursor FlgI
MSRILPLILIFVHVLAVNSFAQTPLRVENVARIEGQDETIIFAHGIVSGLNGTGDDAKSYDPLALAILRKLERSGMSGSNRQGISTTKNSALVEVTVKIPATGARRGDVLDCTIASIGGAKSLSGGVLSATALSTAFQQDENSLIYGMAQGKVTIEQTSSPGVGRVVNGCRILADFTNPYIRDGLVTLVIKPQYSHPRMANRIAESINFDPDFGMGTAKAISPHHLIVRVPKEDFGDPIDFIARILDVTILEPPADVPRVTINERTGEIAISENVEVRPTAITYRNIVADMAPALPAGQQEQFPRQFIDIDTDTRFRQMNGETVTNVRLMSLIASLNAVKATSQDLIGVIKILHKQGAIVGEVVFVE